MSEGINIDAKQFYARLNRIRALWKVSSVPRFWAAATAGWTCVGDKEKESPTIDATKWLALACRTLKMQLHLSKASVASCSSRVLPMKTIRTGRQQPCRFVTFDSTRQHEQQTVGSTRILTFLYLDMAARLRVPFGVVGHHS